MRFFVHTSDDLPVIENIENKNVGNYISPENISKLFDLVQDNEIVFIVDEETYSVFSDFTTIGDYEKCDYVVITDKNIEKFVDKKLKNVLLFVDDAKKFYDNFCSIYNRCQSIEFKFQEITNYDKKTLEESLEKIIQFIIKNLEINKEMKLVKQLNSFAVKEKFNKFGETDFFVDTNLNVYPHASLYYSKANVKCQNLNSFNFEKIYQLTKPHLVCIDCETFYCDRDVYRNKIKTGEYITPCINSCATTEILSKYSKRLFNILMDFNLKEEENFNDRINNFKPSFEYRVFLRKECICNKIKNIDFFDRKI